MNDEVATFGFQCPVKIGKMKFYLVTDVTFKIRVVNHVNTEKMDLRCPEFFISYLRGHEG